MNHDGLYYTAQKDVLKDDNDDDEIVLYCLVCFAFPTYASVLQPSVLTCVETYEGSK